MISAGCDVGSLTAKAVIIEGNRIISAKIIPVAGTPRSSSEKVMTEALNTAGLTMDDIDCCCSTGYGRYDIPIARMNMSEISCHGLGAFRLDRSIRTIIDIGGQDCKVISVDENGMMNDFIMNEKCAAGTGRSLEILSKAIGVDYKELGEIALPAKKTVEISNKCSIFMELDVMRHLYHEADIREIAYAINHAVAKRVSGLAKTLKIRSDVCITGGVSKNVSICNQLEEMLHITFKRLPLDPQLAGALGAAVFAMKHGDLNKIEDVSVKIQEEVCI